MFKLEYSTLCCVIITGGKPGRATRRGQMSQLSTRQIQTCYHSSGVDIFLPVHFFLQLVKYSKLWIE